MDGGCDVLLLVAGVRLLATSVEREHTGQRRIGGFGRANDDRTSWR